MPSEKQTPIVDIRVVQRVKQGFNSEGWADLIIVSERLQVRHQDSDKWSEIDIVIEHIDDKTRITPA
jgi:hypothetical protein